MVSLLLLLQAPTVDYAHLRWVADRYAVPSQLFQGVAYTESRNNLLVGHAQKCSLRAERCAWGRFQLKLSTAKLYCDNTATLGQLKKYGWNVECAAAVLSALRRACDSWICAIKAYYRGLDGEDSPAVSLYLSNVYAYAGEQAWP